MLHRRPASSDSGCLRRALGRRPCRLDGPEYLRTRRNRNASAGGAVQPWSPGFVELRALPHASLMAGLVVALGLVAGASPPVAAAGLKEAEARYQQGDMAGAATLARALGSADGFALAAQATLVEATYLSPDAGKQALFEQA